MNNIQKILKIDHRGFTSAESKIKENTLYAFNNAIKNNFDMIELDVQLCKSNEIIVYHDTFLKYNNKFTPLIDITLDEIKKTKPDLITFQEFIEKVDLNDKMKLYIDVKGNTNTIIQPLIDLLYDNYSTFRNIIISSFNRKHLEIIEEHNKYLTKDCEYYINKGFITENIYTLSELENLLKNKEYFITHWTMIDYETVKYCKENNIKIFCYTAKNNNIVDYLKKYNIDGIVSDILL